MIHRVATRALPRPDLGEYAWPSGRRCVVLAGDDPLAPALARRLTARGWAVEVQPLPDDDEALAALTGRLADGHPVAALLSLAPRTTAPRPTAPSPPPIGEALLGDPRQEAWLLAQFAVARALSSGLHRAAAAGARAWFVAVTRLDGKLGLAPPPRPSSVVSAGVFGLIKTLRLEWPSVFCRAIDLHPGLDTAFAAERVVEELHDPDSTLAEVGHDADGRWTSVVRGQADA